MQVRLYAKQDAPHAPVLELADKWFRVDAWECVPYRHTPCGHCDWDAPAVKRVRAEKLRRLRAFERSGKLPAGWMRPATVRLDKPLTEAEVRRLCFPYFPKADPHEGKMRPSFADTLVDGVVAKYLAAMGERQVSERRTQFGELARVWSCGCDLRQDSGHGQDARNCWSPRVEPCERHRRALVDGAEEVAERSAA